MERIAPALLFFDIDGTLVTDAHTIPESTVSALREARAHGHLALINTGRPYTHIDRALLHMELDGFLCSCGLYLRVGDRVLQNVTPTLEARAAVRKSSLAFRVPVTYEGMAGIFYDGDMPMCADGREEARRLGAAGLPFATDMETFGLRFEKFLAWKSGDADLPAFTGAVGAWFAPIDRGAFLEFVPNGYTKATAIGSLLHCLHREGAPTYAFGDSANDVEMLRAADVSVLMGNAPASLHPYADFVTKAVDADGIAYALRHFGLIG